MVGGTLNRQSSEIWFGGFNVASSTDRHCLRKGQIWNKITYERVNFNYPYNPVQILMVQ